MTLVEPVPGEPAAVATIDGERVLFVADYHAGLEAALRYERGVQVPSRADERREALLYLLELTEPTRLIVLGDLMHSIGDPGGAERGELEVLFESLPPELTVTLVKGNHDGSIETWLDRVDVVPGSGVRIGDVGVCHGHTWPEPDLLTDGVEVVCLGHEHPCVRLEDEVGGSRLERAWLRGTLDPDGFADHPTYGSSDFEGRLPSIVVFPAFNDLTGGTWVNVPGQSFLAPFLPDGLDQGEAYLLDGTRLGPYQSI